MKKSILKQKTKRKKITFSLEAVDAREVHLVGEFNDWKAEAHPMKNDGKGMWVKTLLSWMKRRSKHHLKMAC